MSYFRSIERFFRFRKPPPVENSPIERTIRAAENLMRVFTEIDVSKRDYLEDVRRIGPNTPFEEAIRRQSNLETFLNTAHVLERRTRKELLNV